MMQRGRQVVVWLTPEAVVLVGGATSSGDAVTVRPVPRTADETPLDPTPAHADQLRRIVAEVGLAGRPALVIASSADSTSAVHACPRAAGWRQAREAAGLAIAEAFPHDLSTSPNDSVPLWNDGAGPQPPRTHVLTAAATATTVQTLVHLIESAGLRFDGFLPEPAASMIAAVSRTTSRGTGPGVTMWLGRHGVVLAATDAGQLSLIRHFGVGVGALEEALARPITCRSSGASLNLTPAEAGQVIATVGIPVADTPVRVREGVLCTDLSPALAPVLQRLSVEIKQTLRFGLAPDRRAAADVLLTGPGAVIPNLARALEAACGVPVRVDREVAAIPEAVALARASRRAPRLFPIEVVAARASQRVMLAARLGIAAAAIALAADGGLTWLGLSERRERMVGTPDAQTAIADNPAAAHAAQLQRGVNASLERIDAHLSEAAPWGPLLAGIARSMPPGARLLRIEMDHDSKGAVCDVLARAQGDAAQTADTVRDFIDGLQALPAVTSARLGQVSEESAGGVEFSITLRVRTVPVRSARLPDQEAMP
jgi:Tfp pilus assembly PilM family ATPase